MATSNQQRPRGHIKEGNMTKTIQQRLQSRISRRRNFIRFVEEDRALAKMSRLEIGNFGKAVGLDVSDHVRRLTSGIKDADEAIRGLAEDQRLDKQLFSIIIYTNQERRFYGLSDI